ncbi:Type VI secretion lipoprotein/VasD [Pseudomonas chlororaphis subsp. aureofaciens]|uniref:type VI secretion system lipoprotein TssJ n=1 Tax=Pseudomonas chlororaphis TaxID=587753 RepID=UPI000F584A40|nr:type VI secretion system lipoprotein TssJ [Pseudomonas chlororaphis]AZD86911.1 Type VI secretion lipoprotein/VasD [Pseudomonas chlororaphis subsp. aureofaciens]
MRKAIAILCAGALLSGCSTVGNVLKKTGQVLMDPDIQVGTAEDQPTQIALSLYAGMGVNPNPVAESDFEQESGEALDEGPFAINLHGNTREELVHNLRSLIEYLQDEGSATPTTGVGAKQPLIAETNRGGKQTPFVFGPWLDSVSMTSATTTRAPFPPDWLLRQEGGSEQDSDTQLEPRASLSAEKMALGQYREGLSLTSAPVVETQALASATPVAFRVIQLKDDSLLENADPNQVRSEPKKALGSTYLTSDDYLLVPGQFKFINYSALDEKTRYIAVVAAFHDPNAQRWYDVFRVEPRGRKYALLVTLQDTRVAITDESYRPTQATRYVSTQARKQP